MHVRRKAKSWALQRRRCRCVLRNGGIGGAMRKPALCDGTANLRNRLASMRLGSRPRMQQRARCLRAPMAADSWCARLLRRNAPQQRLRRCAPTCACGCVAPRALAPRIRLPQRGSSARAWAPDTLYWPRAGAASFAVCGARPVDVACRGCASAAGGAVGGSARCACALAAERSNPRWPLTPRLAPHCPRARAFRAGGPLQLRPARWCAALARLGCSRLLQLLAPVGQAPT
jgi:hypothetical protein